MVKTDNTFEYNLIKIGENQSDNDQIITDAKQNDMWFHLSNLPSCHVIITNNSMYPINKEMIIYCAQLVKLNTKYNNYKKLKVNYCNIKNVKKTNIKGKVILKGKINTIIV